MGAVAGREFFEEEAGALDDVSGVALGVGAGGVLEAGGVLDGQAIAEKGVGGYDLFLGEAEAVVAGFFVLEIDPGETGDGVAEGGGIGGDPAFGFQVGGVFQSGGVGFVGAVKGGGEGFRAGLANLKFGAEEGVLIGKSEAGAAACSGGEAFHFGEIGLLLEGEIGEVPGAAALGGGGAGDGGDFREKGGYEITAKAIFEGGLVGGIGNGGAEKGGIAGEDGEGKAEFAGGAHELFKGNTVRRLMGTGWR